MPSAGAQPPVDRCSVCRSPIVVRREDEVLVKNAILRVDRSRRVSAKCPRCKSWVEVPLRYIG
jgi:uncharacterized protein with PIN domain